jgi:hypothetical protein
MKPNSNKPLPPQISPDNQRENMAQLAANDKLKHKYEETKEVFTQIYKSKNEMDSVILKRTDNLVG